VRLDHLLSREARFRRAPLSALMRRERILNVDRACGEVARSRVRRVLLSFERPAAERPSAAAPSPDLENRTSWPNRKKNHRSVPASVAHGTITVKI
jgi:hypothetical protein